MSFLVNGLKGFHHNKKQQVVLFSSTAIALYGYDQGMMSLINTNHSYLSTMSISPSSPLVGVIVSVYYLGCTIGAVLFSGFADRCGRKKGIFACLATASVGNLIMFVSGLGGCNGWAALMVVIIGRVVMGLGIGGVDSVIPVFSSELSDSTARGKAMAQEFQMNIFGLNMAFAINLAVTVSLGKDNQWAWRIPIIVMQVYPLVLLSVIQRLPESPRWFIYHEREEDARRALEDIEGYEAGKKKFKCLKEMHEQEAGKEVNYWNMFTPLHSQFHPTIITIMGQVNQALTGYGAVSVYGPQIFELLGFGFRTAEYLTQGNFISYFVLMTGAWLLIDAVGRRQLMVSCSLILTICFLFLALFGGLTYNADKVHIPTIPVAVLGTLSLFVATGAFGIGWLATVWLIPTEIYPTTARAQGTAISVIIWGVANFTITLLTPIMFNNLNYYLFLAFAVTNAFAGIWTWFYLPESGNRSFNENQEFFEEAREAGSWQVRKVKDGKWLKMPYGKNKSAEEEPLLERVADQVQP